MPRFHNLDGEKIQFTEAEEAQRDKEEQAHANKVAAELDAQPFNDWKAAMEEADKVMPRPLEEHIEWDHGGVAASDYQQTAYDAKKVLRGEQP